ncbi:MAG: hypothetical protein KBA51_01495 [Kiritimatiellae bacterium]|nr:hypothetical protein [Kiritimatiellia bacterium]
MKRAFCIALWAVLVSSPAPAQSVLGFERYQVIIDRAPFGSEPAVETEAVSTTAVAAADDFMKKYRLAMLVGDATEGGYAGLVDLQTNKTIILYKGTPSETGLELLDLQTTQGEATIRYSGQLLLLKMSTTPEAPAMSRAPLSSRGRTSSFPRSRTTTPRTLPAPRPTSATAAPAAESPRLTGPELEQHLREYNMKAIREGMPPLPIPLTPEEDATLVSEGVLPPQ